MAILVDSRIHPSRYPPGEGERLRGRILYGMHLITLSFDDGYIQSSLRIAAIFEQYGLSACFNVVADPTTRLDQWYSGSGSGIGDFPLWNELQARGHEIMPHGLHHEDYTQMTLADAQASIRRCLATFAEKLAGFDVRRAVFNFPYNASTPELETWLPSVVRAFRTAGDGINPLPHPALTRLTCTAFGPGNCEAHLDAWINKLLARPEGWLIYNTHALDEEGWGPLSTAYLERLLPRLLAIPSVRIVPAGKALAG